MQRPQLQFIPKWEGPVELWAKKYIRQNIWRAGSYVEFSDCLQDAYVKFLVCKDRYACVCTPQHFMSLYKTCLRNHFIDLGLAARKPKWYHSDMSEYIDHCEDLYIELERTNLKLRSAIEMFESLDGKKLRVIRRYLRLKNRGNGAIQRRVTFNEVLCFLVGLDPKSINLERMVIDTLQRGEYN